MTTAPRIYADLHNADPQDVPPAIITERNARRAKPVPEAVIERLRSRLDMPNLTGAHRVEWVTGV